eukprot:scaffold69855_cov27-Tisochrysis_lutea.AAC.7
MPMPPAPAPTKINCPQVTTGETPVKLPPLPYPYPLTRKVPDFEWASRHLVRVASQCDNLPRTGVGP